MGFQLFAKCTDEFILLMSIDYFVLLCLLDIWSLIRCVCFTDLRTKDAALRWTTRAHSLGSTGWKLRTSEWMFSRAERMLVFSSCWRGLCELGCISVPLHFPSPVLPERPTSAWEKMWPRQRNNLAACSPLPFCHTFGS